MSGNGSTCPLPTLEDFILAILPEVGRQLEDILHWDGEVEFEEYLLAAAIRLDNLPIVRQYLARNPQLFPNVIRQRSRNLVYGYHNTLAVTYRRETLLEFLLTYATSSINTGLRLELFMGVARASRANIIRYLYV